MTALGGNRPLNPNLYKVYKESADNASSSEAAVCRGAGEVPVGHGDPVHRLVDHIHDALADGVKIILVVINAGRPHEPVDLGVVRAAVKAPELYI